ncbi:unnamed protein product [Amoebophrya sp. A120]|nr:unnamed protein product [Amoebophrya sp. A120]|eukprot:GSA120T00014685001.1
MSSSMSSWCGREFVFGQLVRAPTTSRAVAFRHHIVLLCLLAQSAQVQLWALQHESDLGDENTHTPNLRGRGQKKTAQLIIEEGAEFSPSRDDDEIVGRSGKNPEDHRARSENKIGKIFAEDQDSSGDDLLVRRSLPSDSEHRAGALPTASSSSALQLENEAISHGDALAPTDVDVDSITESASNAISSNMASSTSSSGAVVDQSQILQALYAVQQQNSQLATELQHMKERHTEEMNSLREEVLLAQQQGSQTRPQDEDVENWREALFHTQQHIRFCGAVTWSLVRLLLAVVFGVIAADKALAMLLLVTGYLSVVTGTMLPWYLVFSPFSKVKLLIGIDNRLSEELSKEELDAEEAEQGLPHDFHRRGTLSNCCKHQSSPQGRIFTVTLTLYMISTLLARHPFECYESFCPWRRTEFLEIDRGDPGLARLAPAEEILLRGVWLVVPSFCFVLTAVIPAVYDVIAEREMAKNIRSVFAEENVDLVGHRSATRIRNAKANTFTNWLGVIHNCSAAAGSLILFSFEWLQLVWGEAVPLSYVTAIFDTEERSANVYANPILQDGYQWHIGCFDYTLTEPDRARPWDRMVWARLLCLLLATLFGFTLVAFQGVIFCANYREETLMKRFAAEREQSKATSADATSKDPTEVEDEGRSERTTDHEVEQTAVARRASTEPIDWSGDVTEGRITQEMSTATETTQNLYRCREFQLRVSRLSFAAEVFFMYCVFFLPLLAAYHNFSTRPFNSHSVFEPKKSRRNWIIQGIAKRYHDLVAGRETADWDLDVQPRGKEELYTQTADTAGHFSIWDEVPFPELFRVYDKSSAEFGSLQAKALNKLQLNSQTMKSITLSFDLGRRKLYPRVSSFYKGKSQVVNRYSGSYKAMPSDDLQNEIKPSELEEDTAASSNYAAAEVEAGGEAEAGRASEEHFIPILKLARELDQAEEAASNTARARQASTSARTRNTGLPDRIEHEDRINVAERTTTTSSDNFAAPAQEARHGGEEIENINQDEEAAATSGGAGRAELETMHADHSSTNKSPEIRASRKGQSWR